MVAIAPLQSENEFGAEKERQGSAGNTPTGRQGWRDERVGGWVGGGMSGWMEG